MDQGIFRAFQQTASRLTSDPQLQKDLMQEMFVHLLDLRRQQSGQPVEAYILQCEQHARAYLKRARGYETSPDSVAVELVATRRLTEDQAALVQPRLSVRQQQVLEWLRKGYGIRETARQLGISHPAVIKHRNKIVRALQEMQELAPPDGSSGSAVAAAQKHHEVALSVT